MLPESAISKEIHNIEDGKSSRRAKLPSELSFEHVVKNTVASPCSLGEFMDFLVYENLNAELLQFFIWYCDYIERWSELSPQQKSLSPPWEPARQRAQKGPAAQAQRRDGSDRLNQILGIMEVFNAKKHPNRSLKGGIETGAGSGTLRGSPSILNIPPATARKAGQHATKQRAPQSYTALPLNSNPIDEQLPDQRQPFRDEINMIIKQYITDQAPRRLKISDDELAACQKAANLTTHPSALLRASTIAEGLLKSDCFPRFVHNSQRNANTPRLIMVRVIALGVIMIGFLANQVLVLSSLSQSFRVLSIILWWPSLTTLIAAIQGLCPLLQFRNLRQLRPWEQEQLGETSMQTFGPANKYRRRAFVKVYLSKTMTGKIWDDAVKARNRNIKMLQDRTLFLSICWGGAISSVLTVVSLFIPVMKVW
ncbi:hypothetical protein DHEL01_v210280 [Diaporthe helianthi]|uniref:RGS domain-containing protein n=1 Tax=Diaporthe helianthi TaxID=158607 RepID=A0A2P5HM52_DIAHE|nr:hypothetical protein DHEL01_v210280 [Diaporthe helianthi]